jgi:ATP/maltotriose-dependent transcriptional regulator MalT
MTTLAMVEELRGNLGRALQLIGEGVRLADDSPRREGHQDPLHVVQGSILMELDRLQDARSTLQAGMRVSEELGAHWHLPFYEAYLAMERFLAGGWDDASAELDAALQLVAATGERHSLVLIESLSSLIALHRAISGTPRRPSPGPSTSWPTPAPASAATGRAGPGPWSWKPRGRPSRRSPP